MSHRYACLPALKPCLHGSACSCPTQLPMCPPPYATAAKPTCLPASHPPCHLLPPPPVWQPPLPQGGQSTSSEEEEPPAAPGQLSAADQRLVAALGRDVLPGDDDVEHQATDMRIAQLMVAAERGDQQAAVTLFAGVSVPDILPGL